MELIFVAVFLGLVAYVYFVGPKATLAKVKSAAVNFKAWMNK